jgi:pimeloyl-ACP methyl ester carboxylesterase
MVEATPWEQAVNIEHQRLNVGRLEIHVASLGSGPPVLLLHGFPAYWADWEAQMHLLAASGFRAIAPDLPGYGESGKLPKVLDYRALELAADLAALIRALGLERAYVIGHDWGGTLAYLLAAEHPELVERLIIVNAAHPQLFQRALQRADQLRRSWYIFLFQLPLLPEWLVQRRATISLCLRGMEVRKGAFSDADLERYAAAMRIPGVARAALSYYRAAFRAPARTPCLVAQPTLVLWGDQDHALSAPLLLTGLEQFVPRVRVARFANAGHWLHHDLPEVVSRHVVEFLSAPADS